MKSICFTGLGIVKSPDFELTNDLFFKEMKKNIMMSNNLYNVKYDKKNNKYLVVYNGTTYDVKYHNQDLGRDCEKKDIVHELNYLVDTSKLQKNIDSEKDKNNQDMEKQKESIMYMARCGINDSNNRKRDYIKHLKVDYKNNRQTIIKPTLEIIKDINFYRPFYFGRNRFFSVIRVLADAFVELISIGAIASGVYLFIPVLLAITFDIFDCIGCENRTSTYGYYSNHKFLNGYGGIWASLLSILATPLVVGFSLLLRLSDKIKHTIEVNKIKKTITDLDHEKYMKKALSKSKKSILEASKLLNNIVNNENNNLNVTSEIVNNLKNDILSIKDKKTKDKYANDLYEIIKYFIESSENVKDKKRLYDILNNQINDLKIKVEEELKKEKEQERINEDYSKLMDNINHQKSIGAR
jgi:hypothetical protein